MASWERGYGDFVMRPDLDTLRPVPWQQATAMCIADIVWQDGSDVVASPRQMLGASSPASRSAAGAPAGTELEFMVFRDTYEAASTRATATWSRPTFSTATTRCSPPRASSR